MAERYVLQVYVGALSRLYEALSIEASKTTTAEEIVDCIADKLGLKESTCYELAEVMTDSSGGQDCKERRIDQNECPVALQLLWPKKSTSNVSTGADYKFCLRRKVMQSMNWSLSWTDSTDSQLIRDYFLRFLYQPRDREYPDLCQLPDLTEQTLLENLKARFEKGHIYTYVGSILIAVNPFKFYPIYNPKYVQLYQNRRLGELPPHIFAIADAAYQAMLRKRSNQCIVISGESGSGKTESTNLLLHHLTALSQKGTHGSGVEQTILGAGPVLEAFGNAKTKHNNNSSRFGKFIQVNYKENGAVHGAVVQKYLLEKSRIVSQVKSERNYHVFYYLLAGATQTDKESLYLGKPCEYNYLNQSKCYTLDGVDESYEFARLQQSMEMVGFSPEKQHRCFRVLSAVLHLGNVQFSKKSTYHSDETVVVKNPSELEIISKLLLVKEETLMTALTCKKTKAAKGETLVINYKMPEAIATRDAMAKCLYGALFDWIVMQVNHALLAKKDFRDHKGYYIGVLDIFGFEDFGDQNNFEQFCINYANEHLQFYFNQHVFKYEQQEYKRESITWRNIDFIDNIDCLTMIEGRPHGLLYLLDDQCNFPGANNETVLQKFVNHHSNNSLFEVPPCRPAPAFTIKHYAGKVKYQIRDFREKNMDLMRPDIVSVLKVSQMAFVRELVGADPLAIFRWQILKAFFRAYFIFSKLREMSKMRRGLNDTFIINEISSRRKSTFDSNPKKLIADPNSVNQWSSGQSAPLSRVSKAILSKQALFGANSTPQCIKGSLMKTTSSMCPLHGNQTSLCYNDAKVLSKANKILMKNKSIAQQKLMSKTKGIEKSIKNLKILKQVMTPLSSGQSSQSSNKSQTMGRAVRQSRQTPTVTHQFRESLQHLMETLTVSKPLFVRCIKSNGDKIANHFDDVLVLLQLRYTGMLETVRIRQSGYSVRLSFDEFIQHYRILLPKALLSSQSDVKQFLSLMNLNRDNYQIGKTKIFMRESEKLILDEKLHQEILRRIVTLQRWVRTWLLRRRFKEMRSAVVCIQAHTRRWMAQQRLSHLKRIATYENWAANCIQKNWRAFKHRQWFDRLRQSTIDFQAHCRGFLLRSRLAATIAERKPSKQLSAQSLQLSSDSQIPIDSQSSHSDEAFLSQEEFLDHNIKQLSDESILRTKTVDSVERQVFRECEDSSGINEDIDDSEPELRQKPLDFGDDPFFVEPDDRSTHLDRKRNRVVRKFSLKKSKSKTEVPEHKSMEMPQNKPLIQQKDHKQLMKMTSDSSALLLSQKQRSSIQSIDKPILSTKSGSDVLTAATQSVGALQKAKKTLKTIIGKSSDKSTKSQTKSAYIQPIVNAERRDESLSSSQRQQIAGNAVKSDAFSLMNGHFIRSQTQFKSGELCAVCENFMLGQERSGKERQQNGFKCAECNLLFHSKCVHSCHQIPCRSNTNNNTSNTSLLLQPINQNPSRPPRSKNRKNKNIEKSASYGPTSTNNNNVCTRDNGGQVSGGSGVGSTSWLVTRTTEFVDPRDILITDCDELQIMDAFILKKVYQMDEQKRKSHKESTVDIVFKLALKEFRSNLISTYSVAAQDGHLRLTYKNLIDHFEQVILNVCQKENTWKSFPVIMGVNAFRGYLDELRHNKSIDKSVDKNRTDFQMNSQSDVSQTSSDSKQISKSKRKRLKKQRNRNKKEEEVYHMCGHQLVLSMANIPTVCEVCSSLMWLMEKIWVCRRCKLTCHKKCQSKIVVTCQAAGKASDGASGGGVLKVFGAHLVSLVSDECRIPVIVEHLITTIELKGLYTEGLYRKSGTTSKITELKQRLEHSIRGSLSSEPLTIDLDSYSVHVLSAALKSFFREMAEPLMTYELYDDFLWSTAITDPQEKVQQIYTHISKLPRSNYDLLERLVFHLARVAQQESANRMNANSLAIVFAPCILRTNKVMQMQDKLSDIAKQTACIECIISERMSQIRDTLADIDILSTACHTASSRLSSLRLSKLHLNRETTNSTNRTLTNDEDEEEAILAQQIQHLITEKNHLTEMLPSFRLANAGSDEDLLSSTTDLADDISTGFTGSEDNINFILQSPVRQSSMDFSAMNKSRTFLPKDEPLNHLTKNRVSVPNRRKPSRFESNQKFTTNGENRRRSDSTDYVNQYLDNDKPVMV